MSDLNEQAQAPFISPTPDESPIPSNPWRVLRVPGFLPLITAQLVSSLGDWIGFLAIIAIAGEISRSGFAIGLVMTARMVPSVFLAPVGGALVDRWNRKTVMVTCDIGRCGLIAVIPFWDNLLGLVVLSFFIEVLTLLWSPAKDSTVPNIVKDPDQLNAANSLGVFAAFGTFPLGAIFFSILTGIGVWLGGFEHLHRFEQQQPLLPILVDASTFLVSALLISRLRLPEGDRAAPKKIPIAQTTRDIWDGLKFIRGNALVRGVMIGLGGGLIGGGLIIPLGTLFANDVLQGGAGTFGVLMIAFGGGATIGLLTLLAFQRRLPREPVFSASVMLAGLSIIGVAWTSSLPLAFLLVAAAGAFSGCAYVTGFTLLQEGVSDDLRGRTFGTLYTVVRLCLLLSLTLGPFVAAWLGSIADDLTDNIVKVGNVHLSLPGVRLALWLGGLITVIAGYFAGRRMRKAHLQEEAAGA